MIYFVSLAVVDCEWSGWKTEGCSTSCEEGVKIWSREIIQEDMFGGTPCLERSTHTEICNNGACPGNDNIRYVACKKQRFILKNPSKTLEDAGLIQNMN